MATQPETPAATSESPPAKKSGGASALMPALLAIIGAPALTYAVCQFVLIPGLKKELATPHDPAEAHAGEAAPSGHGKPAASGHGKAAGAAKSTANAYTFENIVVNLAGTMGTRYLKTTFLVTGSDPALIATFESNRAALVDVTINVLSSLSLSDLEEAGSKNLIREKLVQSYNQALGRKVAEQIFFSDFVVQ
jgi:flagellar FliL protein